MVDITEISAMVAAAGVLVGVVYYVLEIRHQSKTRQAEIETRQADLLMRIYSTFGSEEFWKALTRTFNLDFKDYDEFVKKYYSTTTGFVDSPEIIGMSIVNVMFEQIGVLLNRKLIDLGLVDDLFGYIAIPLWEKIKLVVDGYRKQFQSPRSLQQFEYLYNELKKREQQLQQSKA
ncbi:MAG: hypothetical protein ABSB28_05595 [Candidatus Bathyarchaeia archaeon]